MTLPIRVRALAEDDVQRARDFYEERSSGLGARFMERLREALERIQFMPESYGVVSKNVRVKLLDKFPYVVYYRIAKSEILVLAVLHGRRDAAEWKSRSD
jgi:plasmid stabilization system protein ParE